jgi:hypothetical protein
MAVAFALALTACAASPYRPATLGEDTFLPLRPGEPQVERGRPNAFVDGLGHYLFSIPSKILLLSLRVENHDVSPATEAELVRYLHANGLCNVKVRINQYAVGREWSRLFRNRSVGAGFRYTLGILSVVNYTIMPQRVFGGDSYNPYTHTIHLYSDLPGIALHEGGHAKDFVPRYYKGTYAALRLLPLVPLYQEGLATKDALGYRRARAQVAAERRETPLLWGAFASYIVGEGVDYYRGGGEAVELVVFPVAWLAHVIGQVYVRVAGPPSEDTMPPMAPAAPGFADAGACAERLAPPPGLPGDVPSDAQRADDPALGPGAAPGIDAEPWPGGGPDAEPGSKAAPEVQGEVEPRPTGPDPLDSGAEPSSDPAGTSSPDVD